MTKDDAKELAYNYDMLQGCINRLHISDDKEELSRLYSASICYMSNILRLRLGGNYKNINFNTPPINESVENLKNCVVEEFIVGYGLNILEGLFSLYSERMQELGGKDTYDYED